MKISSYRLLILLVAFLSFLGFGCHRKVSDTRLLKAEAMVEASPDSVLMMLDSIGEEGFAGDQDRAGYIMLHAMAIAKCHAGTDNDSTLAWAAEVFSKSGDVRREVKSRFYLGKIYNEKGDYGRALLNFFSVRQLADKSGDDFWAGMACRGIADVYAATYSASDAETYARKAYEYLKKSGRQPFLYWSLFDLGQALHLKEDTKNVVRIADQLLDSADKYDDSDLRYASVQMKMASFISANDYNNALPLAKRLVSMDRADATDSLHYGLILAQVGDLQEARRLVESLPEVDFPLRSCVLSLIYHRQGEMEKAWHERDLWDKGSDEIWKNRSGNTLNSMLNENFEMREKLHREELRNSHAIFAIVVLCILMAGGYAYFLFSRYRNRQNLINQGKITLVKELQEELARTEISRREASEKADSLIVIQDKILDQIASCISSHAFANSKTKNSGSSSADASGKESAKTPGNPASGEAEKKEKAASVYRAELKKAVDVLNEIATKLHPNNAYFKKLEQYAESQHGGIVTRLREDLKNLKEEDYRLFLLSSLNLSGSTTGVLINAPNIGSVYERKRRLKAKIMALPADKAALYLPYLK